MNHLAKQLVDDDGEHVPPDQQCWHSVSVVNSDEAVLCTGEFIRAPCHSGNGALYKEKFVKRGGISCRKCLRIIRQIKLIRL